MQVEKKDRAPIPAVNESPTTAKFLFVSWYLEHIRHQWLFDDIVAAGSLFSLVPVEPHRTRWCTPKSQRLLLKETEEALGFRFPEGFRWLQMIANVIFLFEDLSNDHNVELLHFKLLPDNTKVLPHHEHEARAHGTHSADIATADPSEPAVIEYWAEKAGEGFEPSDLADVRYAIVWTPRANRRHQQTEDPPVFVRLTFQEPYLGNYVDHPMFLHMPHLSDFLRSTAGKGLAMRIDETREAWDRYHSEWATQARRRHSHVDDGTETLTRIVEMTLNPTDD
ncbi:hypothetical protein HDU93_009775 [Gonapodya sp. JEL0774]|nr:hypothetical protein HDU93_009775 [Gonapodya sp. JEL0774]